MVQAGRSKEICTIPGRIWFRAAPWRTRLPQAGAPRGTVAALDSGALPVAEFQRGDRNLMRS